MMLHPIFADALNDAQGAWLITALGVIGFLVGIAVGLKKLFWPDTKISPQPLLIAMEKEFVNRMEYERRHGDLELQVKDGRAYTHEKVHGLAEIVNGLNMGIQDRNERLARLEGMSDQHSRQLKGLDEKLDKVVDRVSDKIENILRRRGEQS